MARSVTPEQTVTVSSTRDLAPARRAISEVALDQLGESSAADVALVVSELVTNALEHGDGGDVVVTYGPVDNEFVLSVASDSSGLPTPERDRVPDDRTHGRGLQIVAALADAVSVEGTEGGVAVECRFRVTGA